MLLKDRLASGYPGATAPMTSFILLSGCKVLFRDLRKTTHPTITEFPFPGDMRALTTSQLSVYSLDEVIGVVGLIINALFVAH